MAVTDSKDLGPGSDQTSSRRSNPFATKHPRAMLAFTAVIALAGIVLTVFVIRKGVAAGIVVGCVFLLYVTGLTALSLWSLHHPADAARSVDTQTTERDDTISRHPLGWSIWLAVIAGVSFPLRILGHEHASPTAWFVTAALGAAFGVAVIQVILWRARRRAAHRRAH